MKWGKCISDALVWFKWMLLIWVFIGRVDGKSNVGREFYFAFVENRVLVEYPRMRIFITSWSSSTVDITIEVPSLFDNPFTYLTLNPRGVAEHYYNFETQMSGNGEDYKGIYIQASGDITVQASNVNELSSDSFLVLPYSSLSSEYYIMTYVYTGVRKLGYTQGPSEFGIVAAGDIFDMTRVEIRFTDKFLSKMEIDMTSLNGGIYDSQKNILIVNLGRCSTFQIQSFEDLTGTHITADKPIAVIVGTMWTSVGTEMMGDHLVEMLPPANTWGGQFFTAPVTNRSGGDVFRILSRLDNTFVRIYHNDGDQRVDVEIKKAEFYDFEADSTDYTHIIANKPILVAQFCKSYNADGNRESDPYFTFVPPVEQYVNNFTFTTLSSLHKPYTQHYISLIVPFYAVDSLRLNDDKIPNDIVQEEWKIIHHTDFAAGTLMLRNGSYSLSCSIEDVPIGAIIYGFKLQESYGHVMGQKLNIITSVCTSVEMEFADYFDNDCDGYIDEEIDNDFDDDGDGLIDEDVYSNTSRRWEGNDLAPLITTPIPLPDTGATDAETTVDDDTTTGVMTDVHIVAKTTDSYVSSQDTTRLLSPVQTTPIYTTTFPSSTIPYSTSAVVSSTSKVLSSTSRRVLETTLSNRIISTDQTTEEGLETTLESKSQIPTIFHRTTFPMTENNLQGSTTQSTGFESFSTKAITSLEPYKSTLDTTFVSPGQTTVPSLSTNGPARTTTNVEASTLATSDKSFTELDDRTSQQPTFVSTLFSTALRGATTRMSIVASTSQFPATSRLSTSVSTLQTTEKTTGGLTTNPQSSTGSLEIRKSTVSTQQDVIHSTFTINQETTKQITTKQTSSNAASTPSITSSKTSLASSTAINTNYIQTTSLKENNGNTTITLDKVSTTPYENTTFSEVNATSEHNGTTFSVTPGPLAVISSTVRPWNQEWDMTLILIPGIMIPLVPLLCCLAFCVKACIGSSRKKKKVMHDGKVRPNQPKMKAKELAAKPVEYVPTFDARDQNDNFEVSVRSKRNSKSKGFHIV